MLFRKEVLAQRGESQFGDVVLASPISHKAMTALLLAIIIGLITFAFVGEYSRKERVVGYLTPDQGLIRLVPRQIGVIDSSHVVIGDKVEKGDKLFSIKIDTISGNGIDMAGTLLTLLDVEKRNLSEAAI